MPHYPWTADAPGWYNCYFFVNIDFTTRGLTCNTNSQAEHDENLAWVLDQIRQAVRGAIDSITCPYCGSNVVLGVEKLCCESVSQATGIVLEYMEVENLCETGEHTISGQQLISSTGALWRDLSSSVH